MSNAETGFNVKTDCLDERQQKESAVLLEQKDKILAALAEGGMHEDLEHPYAYYIPTGLSFDCGKGKDFPIRAIYAVVLMARASYATACLLDCDREGEPELPEFTEFGKEGFHRVYITDPFAWQIDDVIRECQERMVSEGKARIVNGRFYRVA